MPVIMRVMIIAGPVTMTGRSIEATRDRDGEAYEKQNWHYASHREFPSIWTATDHFTGGYWSLSCKPIVRGVPNSHTPSY
jgi:hypothetical protein